jgi:hypothetical protein
VTGKEDRAAHGREEKEPRAFPAPVGFGGTMRAAGHCYRSHFTQLFLLFTLVYIALYLVPLAFPFEVSGAAELPVVMVFLVILPTLGASLAAGIATVVIGDGIAGVHTTMGEARSRLSPHAKDLIAAALLAALIATVLVVILGPIGQLVMYAIIGPPIVVHAVTLESKPFSGAWRRARELARMEAMRIFVYVINVALGITLVVQGSLRAVAIATSDAADGLQAVVLSLLGGVLLGLTIPFLVATGVVSYLDLRARKEDLDEGSWQAERAREAEPA